ncbi:MAG: restriction endonuclease [Pseudomonadota bacterium]
MGRKRKETLLDIALFSTWPTAGVISVGILFFGYVLVPALFNHNQFLKPLAAGLQPLFLILGCAFGAISLFKWIGQLKESAKAPSLDIGRSSLPLQSNKRYRREDVGNLNAGRMDPTSAPKDQTGNAQNEPKIKEWSLELIQSIEWKRFEDVCQKFYELKGIRSECTPLGPDGGIDIRLFQEKSTPQQATAIVQCKAWGSSFVGVKPIRELLGVMVHEKVSKAFFMTSGKYSDEAKAFSAPNRITLIDGAMFLAMLQRLPEAPRQQLLEFSTAGDFNVPTCPSCGTSMRLVQGKEGLRDFWGCLNYPRCRQTLGARRGTHLTTAYYQ